MLAHHDAKGCGHENAPARSALTHRPAHALRQARALLFSLALHGALLGAIALMPAVVELETPPEDAIAVEVVQEPREPPAPAPSTAVPAATTDVAVPPPPPAGTSASEAAGPRVPPETPAGPIHAKTLFSDAVLDHPRSSGTRAMLAQLDEAERIEQLCGLEAMSQIHAWKAEFEPDRVVAYTMAATKFAIQTLQAEGAVFRSKRHWYRLSFTCEMTRDRRKVAAFSFTVGEPVPRREWQARNLPEIH